MKTLIASFFSVALVWPLLAQQPGVDAPLPGQEPQSQLERPISLIPDNAPNISKPPGGSSAPSAERLAKSKTVQSETDLKQRIRLREVKTIALKDPGVQECKERAAGAKTDPEKRDALREYYNRLYARILKIDGSLKELVNQRKSSELGRLSQSRITDASATDEQFATAREEARQ